MTHLVKGGWIRPVGYVSKVYNCYYSELLSSYDI